MKFSKGDLVVVKHTGAEGKIVAAEEDGMFLVDLDGCVVPVFKDNLDHPYFDWFVSDKNKYKSLKHVQEVQTPIEPDDKYVQEVKGVFLGFFPVFVAHSEQIDYFKIYIINQTAQNLKFSYHAVVDGPNDFKLKGSLYPFANFYVHNVKHEHIVSLPTFKVNLMPHARHQSILPSVLKLKPSRLSKSLSELINDGLPYFSRELNWALTKVVSSEANCSISEHKKPAERLVPNLKPSQEVDLHIEKIEPNYRGMSNAAIVQLQLDVFERALNIAITTRQSSLTVIHGVGKGKLKEEIHSYLRMESAVRHFQNDWSPRYGYGATHIFFELR